MIKNSLLFYLVKYRGSFACTNFTSTNFKYRQLLGYHVLRILLAQSFTKELVHNFISTTLARKFYSGPKFVQAKDPLYLVSGKFTVN